MICDEGHLFICFFVTCISSLVSCLLRSLAHILIGLFASILFSFNSSLYILDKIPYHHVFCKYFLPVCALPSHSLYIDFCRAEVFNFNEFSLSVIYLKHQAFGVIYKKSSKHPRSSRFPSMVSSGSFIVLHFTFRSMIHSESIFLKSVRSVSRFNCSNCPNLSLSGTYCHFLQIL